MPITDYMQEQPGSTLLFYFNATDVRVRLSGSWHSFDSIEAAVSYLNNSGYCYGRQQGGPDWQPIVMFYTMTDNDRMMFRVGEKTLQSEINWTLSRQL